jgi:hypothetical protein
VAVRGRVAAGAVSCFCLLQQNDSASTTLLTLSVAWMSSELEGDMVVDGCSTAVGLEIGRLQQLWAKLESTKLPPGGEPSICALHTEMPDACAFMCGAARVQSEYGRLQVLSKPGIASIAYHSELCTVKGGGRGEMLSKLLSRCNAANQTFASSTYWQPPSIKVWSPIKGHRKKGRRACESLQREVWHRLQGRTGWRRRSAQHG